MSLLARDGAPNTYVTASDRTMLPVESDLAVMIWRSASGARDARAAARASGMNAIGSNGVTDTPAGRDAFARMPSAPTAAATALVGIEASRGACAMVVCRFSA